MFGDHTETSASANNKWQDDVQSEIHSNISTVRRIFVTLKHLVQEQLFILEITE